MIVLIGARCQLDSVSVLESVAITSVMTLEASCTISYVGFRITVVRRHLLGDAIEC